MANTIKLKRGSGSNPGTSDLSVGEVALRTDNGTLFTKNDAGNIVGWAMSVIVRPFVSGFDSVVHVIVDDFALFG